MSYFNELVGLSRGADMLRLRLFPDAKEVTESFGAYAAVRRHIVARGLSLGDPTVTLIAVGDGSTPRTAATFALRSAWRCVSVDPRLRWRGRVDCLDVRACRVEETHVEVHGPVVVVAVHSHATLAAALRAVVGHPTRVSVVAIPCCATQVVHGVDPTVQYDDPEIDSPKRRVVVWDDVPLPSVGGAASL